MLLTIAVFFVHKQLHIEPATVALAGATIMLLVTASRWRRRWRASSGRRSSSSSALFVMVGALEEQGAIQEVADGIASVTAGNRSAELLGILWVSGIASGIVDNIPFTATMIPVVEELGGHRDPGYWWALALGACFGGNATIIAAAANVAAAGMASRARAPDRLRPFLKVGIPVTLLRSCSRPPTSPRGTSDGPIHVRRRRPPRGRRCSATTRPVGEAVDAVLSSGAPALPVVDARGALRRGLRRARVHPRGVPEATSRRWARQRSSPARWTACWSAGRPRPPSRSPTT